MFIFHGPFPKIFPAAFRYTKQALVCCQQRGECRLPQNRGGGCHPHHIETSEPDGSTIPSPTGSDCGSRMHLIVLVRLQRGAGHCNVSFDPNPRPKHWATRTRPPGRNARMCLSMGVWVINPTQGVPATVQLVTSCGLLRPLRDGRGARENWRTRARGTQVSSLAG